MVILIMIDKNTLSALTIFLDIDGNIPPKG
jgi:hypothetical protein